MKSPPLFLEGVFCRVNICVEQFLIEEVVNSILKYAAVTDYKLTVKKVERDGYIISNEKQGKIVAIGKLNVRIDGEERKNLVGAFTIDIRKYKWAEAEGFTQDQMIDDLTGEIFDLIGVDEVYDYLCPE